ncbi:hypothetical protein BKA62DRAFT_87445 [Auriculariales sp. MPI-PUGE-AT-0066]|nr:hypothetical protein BKA62DRAFT_87445 [Auriculariales sp. MPI-PUGE-AT-0066]
MRLGLRRAVIITSLASSLVSRALLDFAASERSFSQALTVSRVRTCDVGLLGNDGHVTGLVLISLLRVHHRRSRAFRSLIIRALCGEEYRQSTSPVSALGRAHQRHRAQSLLQHRSLQCQSNLHLPDRLCPFAW